MASLLALMPILINAQTWVKEKSLELREVPSVYSADIQGNFFIGFMDGSLERRNAYGALLENYSLSNNSPISLIDVQNNLRPFLFYFDIQQITILDRFSSVPKNYQLADYSPEITMMACPSPDRGFWVLENNPQRLKKIDLLLKSTVLEVQLHIGDSIKKAQAYQNLLFIADETGIHFFDQFGGYITTIFIKGLISFQTVSGRLLCFTARRVYTLSMDKKEIESHIDLPYPVDGVLYLQDMVLFIKGKNISFYKLIH